MDNWYDKFYKNNTKAQIKNQRKAARVLEEKKHEQNEKSGSQLKKSGHRGEKTNGQFSTFQEKSSRVKNFESASQNLDAEILSIRKMFNGVKLPADSRQVLENFDQIVQSASPLNSRQIYALPKNINALSHSLTDERDSRRIGYMNATEQLSAYVRYFTWWNIVRLTKVFSNLPEECFNLNDGDFCADFGSGPLTVVIALWLSRPELRNKKLSWYCVDISSGAMALGENIFLSIAAKCPPSDENAESSWNIIRVKGETGISLRNKVQFVTSANMFNEISQKSDKTYEDLAKSSVQTLMSYGTENCRYFITEPGVPNCAHFISLARDNFIENGLEIFAPCTHAEKCCMNGKHAKMGGKAKWCNFAFTTEDAPSKLLKLSEQANLTKERAVLSFVFAGKKLKAVENSSGDKKLEFRIASDQFWLPGNMAGFYACSEEGLLLVCGKSAGKLHSGDYVSVKLNTKVEQLYKDEKSGAKKIIL